MIKSNKKGFTLIELLVVIAIIGLLSTLAVVALNSARQKSRDSKRVADIKQIQTALELYFADSTDGYPVNTSLVLGAAGAKTLSSTNKWADTAAGTTYMGLVPASPTPYDGTCTTDNNKYDYTGTATNYSIVFCLGGKVGDLDAGLTTANASGIQ